MNELSRKSIMAQLRTDLVGRNLEFHAQIDSTNLRAVTLARESAPDGTVIVADVQTAGKGRLGRRWHAPAGSCRSACGSDLVGIAIYDRVDHLDLSG